MLLSFDCCQSVSLHIFSSQQIHIYICVSVFALLYCYVPNKVIALAALTWQLVASLARNYWRWTLTPFLLCNEAACLRIFSYAPSTAVRYSHLLAALAFNCLLLALSIELEKHNAMQCYV